MAYYLVMSYSPSMLPPLGFLPFGLPGLQAEKSLSALLVDQCSIIRAGLESRLIVEQQRRALAPWVGSVDGMPPPMSEREYKEALDSVAAYRQLEWFAPLLDTLKAEDLELFLLLWMRSGDFGAAAIKAKEGFTPEEIEALRGNRTPK